MSVLYLFTAEYPYGTREPFLDDELPYLAAKFESVRIVPFSGDVLSEKRSVPENCEVLNPLNLCSSKLLYSLKGIFSTRTFPMFLSEFFRAKVYCNSLKLKNFLSAVFSFNNCLHNRTLQEIEQQLQKQDVCYFYWGVNMNMLATLWKGKTKLVSRFHGEWDLWEESYKGYVPLRQQIASSLDCAAFISRKGLNYFSERYPSCPTAFCPLGTVDMGTVSAKSQDGVLRVLSCSSVYPLKRVDLIFKVLNDSSLKSVEWTHIGGGEDFGKLQNLIQQEKKNHLTVNLLGILSHNDVMAYYQKNPVDVFVNLSVSEGVPVSVMEAASFNVPVVATNVGATAEVVSPQVGELVPENPSVDDVLQALNRVRNGHYEPRQFWQTHYDAALNYSNFANMLIDL